MSRILSNFFLTLGLCCIGSGAFAQQVPDKKGYVGAEYSWVKFKDETSIASILVSAVGGSASSTQDTGISIGRFFGGYSFTENIGAEVGYVVSGTANATFSGTASNGTSYSGTASYKLSGLDYSALVRPSKSSGLNGLFFKLGGHSLSGTNTVTLTTGSGSGAASSTVSGSGTLYGLGYDANISRDTSLRLGYTVYNRVAGVSGSDANVLSVGVAFRF